MAAGDDERALFEVIRPKHQAAHRAWEDDEKFYNGEYGEEIIPEDWADEGLRTPTVAPTAYNAVENAADHILTVPRTYVPPRRVANERQKAQENAERQRQFHDLWWHRVRIDGGDPLGRGKKQLMLHGKMVVKSLLNFDLLPEGYNGMDTDARRRAVDQAGRGQFLWDVQLIPNKQVYEDWRNPQDPHYVYESYEILIADARAMFGDRKIMSNKKPWETIKYLEYWSKPKGDDPGKRMAWLSEEMVLNEENPYSWLVGQRYEGYVPYAIIDAGWGHTQDGADPADRYWGIIRPIRDVVKAETRFVTTMESWLRMYVWPMAKGFNLPETEDGTPPFVFTPGGYLNLDVDAGQDLQVMPWGEIPVSLMQGIERVNQYADEASKFGVLGGAPQRGVDTATEADQNIRNAATKLSPPVARLEWLCMRLNRWTRQCVEHVLRAPVTLHGATPHGASEITIGPRDISGFTETYVELTTSDAQALRAREARLAGDLHRVLPGFSERTALEMAGVTNPLEEQMTAAIERVFNSPPMEQARVLAALEGLGELGRRVQAQMQAEAGLGDEQALTSVDGLGNPAEPVVSDARANATADQAQRAYS